MVRSVLVTLSLVSLSGALGAQVAGKFPPDSLINTQVIPKGTPVLQVVGTMRNFAGGLGVRCPFCHVGEEGKPLGTFDFASDEKRAKLVARQMMRMVQEINRRVDTIPERGSPPVQVTCATCHRGVSRPIPLAALIADVTRSAGADSAVRAYRALRQRYYGRDAYDFSDFSLNSAAFQVARANRIDDAFALLRLNEEMFPTSAAVYLFRGNVNLMKGDTTAAVTAFRESVKRDPNSEARGRLRDIGQSP